VTIAAVLSLAGLAAVLGSWVLYLASIPRGKVPARPIGSIAAQILGTALAIGGVAWSFRGGGAPGAAVIAPAAVALIGGPLFLWLLTQRETPVGDIRVAVGDPLIPFAATASDGASFDSGELAGERVLLKFFRGHW
jgi:hypothetical protein